MPNNVATAEISRSQLWQWLRYGADLEGGGTVTPELVRRVLDEEQASLDEPESYAPARAILDSLIFTEVLEPFLTDAAYELLD